MLEGGGGFVYTGVSYEAQRGIVRRLDNFMMLRGSYVIFGLEICLEEC